MIHTVIITTKAQKQLIKVPWNVAHKLAIWQESVENDGLEMVRRIPGYHDEPLQGKRAGQRSIRLNRSYRAIYVIKKNEVKFVSVEEVSKHEY